MITLILAYDEIDQFKATKLERYYWVMKKATLGELSNVTTIGTFWNSVVNNEKLKPVSV